MVTNTPVPKDFTFTWSYGSVSTYKNCPLRYWAEKVAKVVPYEKNEKTLWGEDVHEALEKSARDKVQLPSNMSQYLPTLQKVEHLATISQHVEYERQFAVTAESVPCGWWDKGVSGRAAADVFALVIPEYAIIIDYKTGKPPWGQSMQPVINAKMVFDHYPTVQRVDTSFVYMHHDRTDYDKFERAHIDSDFQPVAETMYRMKQSIANENFPAVKHGLCKKHCGFFECPHNGRIDKDNFK